MTPCTSPSVKQGFFYSTLLSLLALLPFPSCLLFFSAFTIIAAVVRTSGDEKTESQVKRYITWVHICIFCGSFQENIF